MPGLRAPNILIKKNNFNPVYFPLLKNKSRYLVLFGGSSSGKSHFIAQRYVARILNEKPCNIMVVRQVSKDNRNSTFNLFKQIINHWQAAAYFKINEGDMRITCLKNGNMVIFTGLDDVENLKSTTFPNGEMTDIWLEEANQTAEGDFNQLDVRLRGGLSNKQITVSFNPISITHWLKKKFFDHSKLSSGLSQDTYVYSEDDIDGKRVKLFCTILHTTYKDNMFLGDAEKLLLESYKDTDPYYYEVYCLGHWGVTGATVFDKQKVNGRIMEIRDRQPLRTGYFRYDLNAAERIINDSIEFIDSPDGYIRIYKDTEAGHPYVIGGDTAGEGSDFFVNHVMDNSTGEQIAKLRCQSMDEDLYAKQTYCMGIYFNTALIGLEVNFSTYPVKELERLEYPNMYTREMEDTYTHTVQIMEFWYKDDNGDVNCSILINEQEIRNTGLYWANTHNQCKLFPFVKYCKIADENNFWDRSELESIIDLTDAADRELAYGLENAAFTSNDMILLEDGALSDGETIKNQPGAIVHMKPNKSATGMRRFGGLNSLESRQQSIEFMQSQIEKTIGNFDTSMGVEPDRVTTASGIAQLNERADSRKNIKKVDRIIGFEKLYELIDWTALEFYDDDRLIFIGTSDAGLQARFLSTYNQQVQDAKANGQPAPPMSENLDKNKGPIIFEFNAESLASKKYLENPDDPDNPTIETYYPRVDCMVIASDSLSKSKAFTVQSLQTLISMGITIENYKIVEAWVDLLNLPQRKEIKDYLENYFQHLPVGIPKTTLNYKDLSPDGKVQLANKIGLSIQTPAPADSQNVPYAMLVQNAPSSGVNTPQIATTQNGKFNPQVAAYLDKIIGNGDGLLSPDELQYLQQHPEIIEQMLTEGANQNGQ